MSVEADAEDLARIGVSVMKRVRERCAPGTPFSQWSEVAIEELSNLVGLRLASVEARLWHLSLLAEKTDDDVGGMSDRIAKLEAYVEDMNARRAAAVEIRRATANRIDGLERRIGSLEDQLEAAIQGERAADLEVQRLQAKNAELRGRIDRLETPAPARCGVPGCDEVAAIEQLVSTREPDGVRFICRTHWHDRQEKPGPSRGGRPIVLVGEAGGDMRAPDEQTADLIESLVAENARLAEELAKAEAQTDLARAAALGDLRDLAEHYRRRSTALGVTAINELNEREANDDASRARATAKAEAIEHAAAMLAKRWG